MNFTIEGTPFLGVSKDTNTSGAWWSFNSNASLLCLVDNTYDIGASGANRPRSLYLGTNLFAAGLVQAGSGGVIGFLSRSYLKSPSDGVMQLTNTAETDFNRLQLGGITSAFPAIKRNSSQIDIRLADDSAFAAIRGRITTHSAYTAGVPSATGYLTLYDSNGIAYRVPCVAE
jgi:hypothetical protein